MISLSGIGADSPWRDYVAFGMSTEQMAGFTHLTAPRGHTSEVLREYAGLRDDDIAELVIDDVVGTVPIAAR